MISEQPPLKFDVPLCTHQVQVKNSFIALPYTQWPVMDQRLWERSFSATNPFDFDAPQAYLAPPTLDGRRKSYASLLTFLKANNPSSLQQSPGERITREIMAAYVDSLRVRQRASSIKEEINRLATVMKVIAPEKNWSWMRRLPNMPTPGQIECSKKPIIPPDSAVVINAAFHYFDNADAQPASLWNSIKVRDAIIVSIAALFAIRRLNLQEIVRGEHLLEDGSTIRIAFNDSLKNHTAVLFDLPEWLTPRFTKYLQVHRPLLLGRQPDKGQLWVTRRGGKLSCIMLGEIFAKFGKEVLGHHLTIHSFRHAMANTIILRDPGDIDLAAAALGHTTNEMVTEVYTKSAGQELGRLWHKQRKARMQRLDREI